MDRLQIIANELRGELNTMRNGIAKLLASQVKYLDHCRTAVAWVGGADARATFEIRSCYSYVVGIADAHKYLVAAGKMASPGFCVITEITDKQLANVFLSYYNRDRTKLEFVPAAEVVLKAMFDKFPCKS